MTVRQLFTLLSAAILSMSCVDAPGTGPVETVAAVAISPTARDLKPGESVQLTATPQDASGKPLTGRTVTWTSSNDIVASVTSAGIVHASGLGTATIWAQVENKKGQATITVAEAFTPVASVHVTPGAITVHPEQQVGLSAEPRDAAGGPLIGRPVTWSSLNPSVATVSNTGVVTAVSVGTATIKAESEGKEGTAAVTVEPANTVGPVSRVELDRDTATLAEGEQIALVATPRDSSGNAITGLGMQWSSSDPTVASVDALGGTTAIKAGTTAITVKVHGQTATALITVTADYAYDLVFETFVPDVGLQLARLDIRDRSASQTWIPTDGYYAEHPAVSPEGERIAYSINWGYGNSSIFVADIDGSNPVRLTFGVGLHDQPTWSHDGSKIAYRRWYSAGGEGADIWMMNADGSDPVNLTEDQGYGSEHDPAWSPDGERIAYARLADTTISIWTMDPDGGNKLRITGGSADVAPSWSPDGQSIVFQRIGDIVVVGTTYETVRTLVSLPFGQFAPAYAPDGRLIAFSSKDEHGVYQIYTVWPDGSKLAQRTSGETDHNNPTWVQR